jgi:hypothetical protein
MDNKVSIELDGGSLEVHRALSGKGLKTVIWQTEHGDIGPEL